MTLFSWHGHAGPGSSRIRRLLRGILGSAGIIALLIGLPLLTSHLLNDEPAEPHLPPQARARIETPGDIVDWLAFLPRENRLIWADYRWDQIGTWDARSGSTLLQDEESPAGLAIAAIALALGAEALAVAHFHRGIAIWDLTGDADEPRRLAPSTWSVRSLAFTPDGQTLVAAGWDDMMIRTWNTSDWRETRAWTAQSQPIASLDISRDGQTFVIGSSDGWLRRWDLGSGRLLSEWPGHSGVVHRLAHAPDGRTLASACNDGSVRLWDTNTHALRLSLPNESHNDIHCLAYSPQGTILATGDSARRICLWDAATGRLVRQLVGHQQAVRALAFAPDGQTLTSGGSDGTILLWDVSATTNPEARPSVVPVAGQPSVDSPRSGDSAEAAISASAPPVQ